MSQINAVKEFIIENFLFGEEEQLNLDTDFFDKGIISIDDEELIPENLSSLNKVEVFLQKKLSQKVA